MTGQEILDMAERLQRMADNYPNPQTKAALLQASGILFRHIAVAVEAEAQNLIDDARKA